MLAFLILLPALADDSPIQVVQPGATAQASTLSYLLPESKYNSCLLAAQEVPILETALADARALCSDRLREASQALEAARDRQAADAAAVGRLEARVAVLETQARDLRRQRNTAIGVMLGVVAVGGLAAGAALGAL